MSDNKWPMCGSPTGSECDDCATAAKPCYCDRPADEDES